MPSNESLALKKHFESMNERNTANPDMDLTTLRSMMEELSNHATEPEDVTYSEVDADGVRGIWCNPLDASPESVLLYTHGGGFIGNSANSHRKLAGHLAKAMGARAFVVEYRLAPEHPFPAQLDDAYAAHQMITKSGIDPSRIVTAGDSAGGNLAISLVTKLKQENETLPAATIGFSPWVDMENKGTTLETNAETDAFLSRPVVEMFSSTFLGENTSPTNPLANPLYADFTGFPPLFLTAGGDETLQDNAERVAELARAAGVEVELTVEPEQQHVFQFMVGRAPEATKTVQDAGAWARRILDSVKAAV